MYGRRILKLLITALYVWTLLQGKKGKVAFFSPLTNFFFIKQTETLTEGCWGLLLKLICSASFLTFIY